MYRAHNILNANLRLYEVTVGAKLLTTLALIIRRERRHHDYFNVFRFGCRSQNIKHIKAGNLWHHDIADDE